jgi:hypothetical protein
VSNRKRYQNWSKGWGLIYEHLFFTYYFDGVLYRSRDDSGTRNGIREMDYFGSKSECLCPTID